MDGKQCNIQLLENKLLCPHLPSGSYHRPQGCAPQTEQLDAPSAPQWLHRPQRRRCRQRVQRQQLLHRCPAAHILTVVDDATAEQKIGHRGIRRRCCCLSLQFPAFIVGREESSSTTCLWIHKAAATKTSTTAETTTIISTFSTALSAIIPTHDAMQMMWLCRNSCSRMT